MLFNDQIVFHPMDIIELTLLISYCWIVGWSEHLGRESRGICPPLPFSHIYRGPQGQPLYLSNMLFCLKTLRSLSLFSTLSLPHPGFPGPSLPQTTLMGRLYVDRLSFLCHLLFPTRPKPGPALAKKVSHSQQTRVVGRRQCRDSLLPVLKLHKTITSSSGESSQGASSLSF